MPTWIDGEPIYTPKELLDLKRKTTVISCSAIHQNAKNHGWYETHEDRSVPTKLCLIHSEVSEALEAYRNDIPYGEKGCLPEELADVVIRVFDLCGLLGIDIAAEIEKKHMTNLYRPHRHGGKKV